MTHYLIALDPGKSSGLSIIDISDLSKPEIWWTAELDQFSTCSKIEEWLMDHSDDAEYELVCESFHVTPATAKKSPGQWSSEIIGTTRYLCEKYGVRFTLQTPTAAKNFVDNARLRDLGLWHRGGEGHANDSLRHAVLYLVEKKNWRPANLSL